MCKTIGSPLLQLAIFVLLLNFSHAYKYFTINIFENYKDHLVGNTEEEIFDIFRNVYNFYKNGKYLSNIKSVYFRHADPSSPNFIHIAVARTTCTYESEFNKCLEKEYIQYYAHRVTRYMKSEEVTCKELLSKLASCPFNEKEYQYKRAICYIQIYNEVSPNVKLQRLIIFNCKTN